MIALGVIPARGGSKSIPLKNIKELCGKPLIAYSIESARKSQLLSKVVVSTDHKKIASVAEEYNCEVIIRPSELAIDTAPTEWALLHVLEALKKKEGFEPDIVLTLEPTSPFRTVTLIDRCIDIFNNTDADSIIGVVQTPTRYGRIINGRFEFLFPEQKHTPRRQDRQSLYEESSTIYATRTEILIRKKSVLGDKLYPIIVSELEAIDINTLTDFYISEAVMMLKEKKQ